jgi:hypothetical protein
VGDDRGIGRQRVGGWCAVDGAHRLAEVMADLAD